MDQELKELLNINRIIQYMEATTEDSWIQNVVRREDKNCFFGHLFNYAGGDNGGGSDVWGLFEELFATTYMIYPVNDGENPNFLQETPKQRIIQYLKDLRDGKAKTAYQLMAEAEKLA